MSGSAATLESDEERAAQNVFKQSSRLSGASAFDDWESGLSGFGLGGTLGSSAFEIETDDGSTVEPLLIVPAPNSDESAD